MKTDNASVLHEVEPYRELLEQFADNWDEDADPSRDSDDDVTLAGLIEKGTVGSVRLPRAPYEGLFKELAQIPDPAAFVVENEILSTHVEDVFCVDGKEDLISGLGFPYGHLLAKTEALLLGEADEYACRIIQLETVYESREPLNYGEKAVLLHRAYPQ